MTRRNEIRRLAQRRPTHNRRRRRRAYRRWFYCAVTAGVVYVVTHFLGKGSLRAEAGLLALLAFFAALFARHLRLRQPESVAGDSRISLGKTERHLLLALFGIATIAGGGFITYEANRGYPNLEPVDLMGEKKASSGFYTATGNVDQQMVYAMNGSEGERWAAPLKRFEGRLLVLFDQKPPVGTARVTGRLRKTILAVQTAPDGAPEGPFAVQYRTEMGLPKDTPIYYLDTGMRAGLNALAIAAFVVPFYLFFLIVGVPEARPRTLFTRRKYADPRRRRPPPTGDRPAAKPRT